MSKKMENASRGPQAAQPFPPQLDRSYLSVKHLLTPRESMVQTFWDRIFYVPQRKQCFCQKVMTLARSFTPIFCSLFWRYCRRQ